MAHGRGGRTPRRDTPRVSAIGLARTPTLRKAVAFEQRRGSKPPLRGDRGSGGGARAALRSSVGTARAHTLVHLLPLVASSGMRKQTYLYGLGIRYHPAHVSRLLKKLRLSLQKPQRLADQRDEDAIEHWKDQKWPSLKKGR